MKIKLKNIKDRRVYLVAFDEYGDLDTVSVDGVNLASTNTIVKSIVRNAEKIRAGVIPTGFTKAQ